MKEALSSPYNKLIFRETFRDESSVRKNGGTPTNVTFSDGVATIVGTASRINYASYLNGVYSVRIRYKVTAKIASNQYLFDARGSDSNGTGYAYLNSGAATINLSSGIGYVNGVAAGSITYGSMQEIVITGISLVAGTTSGQNTLALFNRHSFNYAAVGTCDLFEIYQGTLTASEVANLYNNTWNKEVSGYGGQCGSNIITNGAFDNDVSGWGNVRSLLTWEEGGYCKLTQNAGSTGAMAFVQTNKLTIGKKYKITFIAKAGNYTGSFNAGSVTWSNQVQIKNPTITSDWQEYEFEAIATNTEFRLYTSSVVADGTTFFIDNVTVQELNPDLLLDFDSTQGTIKDRTGKRTLTPTYVSIKKIGQSYSADFNGTTSKIDTGTDFIGTKAITVMGWIKPYSWGEGSFGRIIDNAKTLLWLNRLLAQYVLSTTTGNVVAKSATNSVILNKLQFLAVTRTSAGVINFYIGDKTTAPLLSGSADQTDGTPVAGTTNVIIGNNSVATRTFYGSIPMLKVVEGILSLEDITQIWSSTRGKFI